jgi:hypothetical protein
MGSRASEFLTPFPPGILTGALAYMVVPLDVPVDLCIEDCQADAAVLRMFSARLALHASTPFS